MNPADVSLMIMPFAGVIGLAVVALTYRHMYREGYDIKKAFLTGELEKR
ncbi:hypothetical protein VB779_09300 [Haloarculaceae archaeon H-GB11]|nr:hypothetical protein [Haloarculaceae archaeon H-GB11]